MERQVGKWVRHLSIRPVPVQSLTCRAPFRGRDQIRVRVGRWRVVLLVEARSPVRGGDQVYAAIILVVHEALRVVDFVCGE